MFPEMSIILKDHPATVQRDLTVAVKTAKSKSVVHFDGKAKETVLRCISPLVVLVALRLPQQNGIRDAYSTADIFNG